MVGGQFDAKRKVGVVSRKTVDVAWGGPKRYLGKLRCCSPFSNGKAGTVVTLAISHFSFGRSSQPSAIGRNVSNVPSKYRPPVASCAVYGRMTSETQPTNHSVSRDNGSAIVSLLPSVGLVLVLHFTLNSTLPARKDKTCPLFLALARIVPGFLILCFGSIIGFLHFPIYLTYQSPSLVDYRHVGPVF